MLISSFTGSREPSDNWTSLYTFAVGIIGGSFLAIGFGEVDMAEGLRGDLLRIYLTLITAIIAGGVAFAVSRVGDRISDRRKRTRAVLILLHQIGELRRALQAVRHLLPGGDPSGKFSANSNPGVFVIACKHANQCASRELTFTDVIDDLADLEHASEIRLGFDHAARVFNLDRLSQPKEVLVPVFTGESVVSDLDRQLTTLKSFEDFYGMRLRKF